MTQIIVAGPCTPLIQMRHESGMIRKEKAQNAAAGQAGMSVNVMLR